MITDLFLEHFHLYISMKQNVAGKLKTIPVMIMLQILKQLILKQTILKRTVKIFLTLTQMQSMKRRVMMSQI